MMKIEHIGIAVKSLSEAVKVYEQAIGLKVATGVLVGQPADLGAGA